MDWELFHSATNLLIVLKSPGTVGWTECLDGAIFGRGFLGVSNDRRIQEPAPSVPAMGCKMGGALSGTASADGPGRDGDKNGRAASKKKDFSKVLCLSASSSSVLCSDAE